MTPIVHLLVDECVQRHNKEKYSFNELYPLNLVVSITLYILNNSNRFYYSIGLNNSNVYVSGVEPVTS